MSEGNEGNEGPKKEGPEKKTIEPLGVVGYTLALAVLAVRFELDEDKFKLEKIRLHLGRFIGSINEFVKAIDGVKNLPPNDENRELFNEMKDYCISNISLDDTKQNIQNLFNSLEKAIQNPSGNNITIAKNTLSRYLENSGKVLSDLYSEVSSYNQNYNALGKLKPPLQNAQIQLFEIRQILEPPKD